MASSSLRRILLLSASLTVACGGDDATDPSDVTYGETTIVVVVNPTINTANGVGVASPGAARSDVSLDLDDGPSSTSSAGGVAVLAPVTAGDRTLSLTGGGDSGDVAVSIADGDLREVAVALDASGATVMADLRYAFGGAVVEVDPSTPIAEVNAALTQSNVIVFFESGTYTGDLEFSGSNVTLFGEGTSGGEVTLDGNVTVSGSGNRIRGALITGDLSVPGSGAGLSFSRVDGVTTISGSSPTLLNNTFCGEVTVTGSGPLLLGNGGLEPIAGGC
jgi:hypothetical protein